ncbi:DUF6265 family protein [Flavobacterium sp. WC2421]|jgi:hypothetical protein|uniref:DUF6265 family protein n=3 Tax=unclassified Flavobacterium TaxID=196869 RepID=A0AB39WGE6_9FLAO
MFKKITLLLLIVTLLSCKKSDSSDKNEKDKIKTAHWLLGTWENKTAEGNLSETWEKVNDSTYEGQSYFIKGKDTIHFETIQLQQKGEELTYNANVQGQNEDKPVPFKLTKTTEKELVFENPKHDYPQKISYKSVSKDSLIAEISGMQSGKPSSEKYVMTKSK